jgi:hypothetical protein
MRGVYLSHLIVERMALPTVVDGATDRACQVTLPPRLSGLF